MPTFVGSYVEGGDGVSKIIPQHHFFVLALQYAHFVSRHGEWKCLVVKVQIVSIMPGCFWA